MYVNTCFQINDLHLFYFIKKKKKEKKETCLQQQTAYTTQRFHLLIFSCLLKRMVLPLIMKTEKNFK